MTNKEAFAVVIQVGSVDDNTLEMNLIEAGINPSATFTKGDAKSLELAAIPVLQSLLSISSVSEGGYSISTPFEGIKQRLLFLANKHGLKDLVNSLSDVPKITDASGLW